MRGNSCFESGGFVEMIYGRSAEAVNRVFVQSSDDLWMICLRQKAATVAVNDMSPPSVVLFGQGLSQRMALMNCDRLRLRGLTKDGFDEL